MPLHDVRREFERCGLRESDIAADPLEQFRRWLDEARAHGELEPTGMVLSTLDEAGNPAARMVLLKGVDAAGFTFFTNYQSAKGRQLERHPQAALTFFWAKLERQVRVCGSVTRTSTEESRAYFASRPRGSQLGAWASAQSQAVADRATLDRRLVEVQQRLGDGPVPLPPHWGGYRVRPRSIEFWQGRPDRMHDRLRYDREGDGPWRLTRLSP